MPNLKVKLLHPNAKAPVCANPGSDLGFDLFAVGATVLEPNKLYKIRTGIAVEMQGYGFIIKDRGSMASKGIFTHAGVVDVGYTGEIIVLLSMISQDSDEQYLIKPGDKIAQMLPVSPVTMGAVICVSELTESARGAQGFGSTGT